jgi:hypothetical protein
MSVNTYIGRAADSGFNPDRRVAWLLEIVGSPAVGKC